MVRRGIILAAVLIYVMVLACAMPLSRSRASSHEGNGSISDDQITQGSSADNSPELNEAPNLQGPFPHASLTGLPYRSISMQIQRVDWMDRYKKGMDQIAALGADTVLLVVDSRQENGQSDMIYLDMRMTPTVPQLGDLIDHAKALKLRVILMPIVLLDKPRGNEWRGTLAPLSWDDWFDSYRQMITHFAQVAQDHHVDVLVVGSELVSTEPKLTEWTKTIRAVRDIYKGQLTYSSNWDHYTSIGFWDQLDLVGMNSYWKFAEPDHPEPTVEQIEARWRSIQKEVLSFVQSVHKPLLFTEIGWFSQKNVAYEPWDYTQEDQPIDLDLQKRLYEGFFNVWYGNPWLGGFSVWEWKPGEGGPENTGYTPKGKPAEQVLKQWLAKPRWKVELTGDSSGA